MIFGFDSGFSGAGAPMVFAPASLVQVAPRCQCRLNGRQCDLAGTMRGSDGLSYCSHDHMFHAMGMVRSQTGNGQNNSQNNGWGNGNQGNGGWSNGNQGNNQNNGWGNGNQGNGGWSNGNQGNNQNNGWSNGNQGNGFQTMSNGVQVAVQVGVQVNQQSSSRSALTVPGGTCGVNGCTRLGLPAYNGCCDFSHQRIRDQRAAAHAAGYYVNPYDAR
jgi:hypothetical protein